MPTADAFEAAVGRHDARVAALGLTVWVGSEPTFTDRHAQTPEWISQALGGEKEERALAATAALFRRFPGAVVLRRSRVACPLVPAAPCQHDAPAHPSSHGRLQQQRHNDKHPVQQHLSALGLGRHWADVCPLLLPLLLLFQLLLLRIVARGRHRSHIFFLNSGRGVRHQN